MENTERNKFEQAWQEVFAQAEQTPSQEVWMSVERNLAVAEGGQMKRKVVFYQRIAAAAVLIALVLGAITTYYVVDESGETRLTENAVDPTPNQKPAGQAAAAHNHSNQSISENQDDTRSSNPDRGVVSLWEEQQENKDNKISPTSRLLSHPDPQQVNFTNRVNRNVDFVGLEDIYVGVPAEVKGKPHAVELIRKLPAMPASMMADTKQKNKSGEQLWAALGAAAGNYTPQVSGGYAMQSASGGLSSGNQGSSDASSKGNAYSFGFNVGTRLSDRWVLQGGLAYMNQAIDYTSTMASVSSSNKIRALVADYAFSNSGNSVTLTNPYEINSINEYVSIPVQAGYLVLNRKAGIQINSGLATDIFLRNTLTDKSGQLDTYSEGAGDNSPYRTFSWSALMGTELSYKLGTHYRVALAPGLRYSLSPVVKSDASSNPLVWDLGFRFRYIFN